MEKGAEASAGPATEPRRIVGQIADGFGQRLMMRGKARTLYKQCTQRMDRFERGGAFAMVGCIDGLLVRHMVGGEYGGYT